MSFSATYVNSGSYDVIGADIAWHNRVMVPSRELNAEVEDFEFLCEGIDGAVCPDIDKDYQFSADQKNLVATGKGEMNFTYFDYKPFFKANVKTWPANSRLKYTIKFKIKSIYWPNNSCSLNPTKVKGVSLGFSYGLSVPK